MVRSTGKVLCALALFSMLLAGGQAEAQNAVLNELYGNGAHAFFAGDYQRAYDELSAAVGGGSKDPRVFYFRGFTLSRLGREDEAAADFKTGATLESADVNQFYPVGKSLERVQGASRLSLERERSVARAVAYQRQQQRNTVRYEQFKRAETAVLREPASGAADAGAAEPATKAPPKPKAPPVAAADDPFADTAPADGAAMPAEEKPADDPFGEPDAPAKPGKSAKPAAPAEAEEDPFAAPKDGADAAMPEADAPAKDDAMEDNPPPKPPAAKKPAGKAAAAEEEDPFAAGDDAMAAPPAAAKKKAAPAKNAAPAADDPFADAADEPAAPTKPAAKAAPKKPAPAKPAMSGMDEDPFK